MREHPTKTTTSSFSIGAVERVSFCYEGNIVAGEILAINGTMVRIGYAFDANRDAYRTIDEADEKISMKPIPG
jgi:hypothetical protein